MTAVVLTVEAITIIILYQTAINQQKLRLIDTIDSQARLIEAAARFNKKYNTSFPFGIKEATLQQLTNAHSTYRGLGQTGEFTLSKKENDQIIFLLSHRHYDLDHPKPVPWDSHLAEPMRQALSGKSGTIIGLDYRGEKVLAAYEPVAELDLGIVAKIDLAEVREPFLHAGLLSAAIAVIIISIGVNLFFKITNPILKNLEETSEQVKRFAYTMAHDLKNPTIALCGLTSRLRANYNHILDEKGKNSCDQILKSSRQLATLIDNINTYILTQNQQLKLEKVQLTDLAQDIKEEFSAPLTQQQVELTASAILPAIKADRLALLRVLRNLIQNALKYGGEHLDTIEVRYAKSDKFHILSVKDNGIGIPAGEQEKIFAFLEQGTNSPKLEGFGFGLAIVQEIAEQHGGRAWCEPGKRAGVEFFISISKEL
ncbi:MAG: ATP-binding protein [Candidatus Electrothrix aestuarii]|uniref:histidine kinase n=1 Tax=Candidatus Electrothrix aestuarii TaxID=3062594 RepID=A0AAU8LX81_9BACT|nr:ATP-binding protein [Candidatus Electrothrix aestuarii]